MVDEGDAMTTTRPMIVGVRFTAAERKEVERAAAHAGLALSQFVRVHVLRAAREITPETKRKPRRATGGRA